MSKLFKRSFYFVILWTLLPIAGCTSDDVFLKRVETARNQDSIRDVDWFEPKAALRASNSAYPLIISNESQQQRESQFKSAIDYAQSMGSSALLVWQKGDLLLEKYWGDFNQDSYTQSHSIHKSLLSLAVGVAITEGSIDSVNDPVSKYIGDWTEQPFGQITIEHMLTMASGLKLPAFDSSFSPTAHSVKLLYETDISEVARSLPQVTTPGKTFSYNNSVPQILVDVLEQATGQQYEVYLQEKIWSKFAANEGYLWMDRKKGTPHGFCCLIAKPRDLVRLGLLLLDQGKVGDAQVIASNWIQSVTKPSEVNPNYGYYIWRGTPHSPLRTYSEGAAFGVKHSEAYLADDVIYFDGFGGQRVYIIPSLELVIVRIGDERFDFDDAILPNRIIQALEQASNVMLDSSNDAVVKYHDTTIKVGASLAYERVVDIRVTYPITNLNKSLPLVVLHTGIS